MMKATSRESTSVLLKGRGREDNALPGETDGRSETEAAAKTEEGREAGHETGAEVGQGPKVAEGQRNAGAADHETERGAKTRRGGEVETGRDRGGEEKLRTTDLQRNRLEDKRKHRGDCRIRGIVRFRHLGASLRRRPPRRGNATL